jgi:hypothetical protein
MAQATITYRDADWTHIASALDTLETALLFLENADTTAREDYLAWGLFNTLSSALRDGSSTFRLGDLPALEEGEDE